MSNLRTYSDTTIKKGKARPSPHSPLKEHFPICSKHPSEFRQMDQKVGGSLVRDEKAGKDERCCQRPKLHQYKHFVRAFIRLLQMRFPYLDKFHFHKAMAFVEAGIMSMKRSYIPTQ